MHWITATIVVAATSGIVAIIDSHLIARRMPSLSAYLLPMGAILLVFGAVVLVLYPLPLDVGMAPLLVLFGSALLRAAGALLMLRSMRFEEVSRVMPVVQTFPIFVAILAVPLLGESLGYLDWLSILMTVAGAVLISVRRGTGGRGATLSKTFGLLLACSFLLGVANTASKYALDYVSYWNVYAVDAVCFSLVFLTISARGKTRAELGAMKQRGLALGLLTLKELIAFGTALLYFWAVQQGPVSLVSAILSVRPALVFIYAVVISRIFPAMLEERLSRGAVVIKLISIGLIIGGVTLLTFIQ